MAFPEGDKHIDELLEDVRHPASAVVPGVDDRRRRHSHSRGWDTHSSADPGERQDLIAEYHDRAITEAINDFESSQSVNQAGETQEA